MSKYNSFLKNHWIYAWAIVVFIGVYLTSAGVIANQPPITFGELISRVDAAPGYPAAINVHGERHKTHCTVEVTRTVLDSVGEYRQAFGANFDKDELKRLQKVYGDIIPIRFLMPLGLKPGPGEFINDAFYTCGWWHRIFGRKKVQYRTLINILEPPR